MANQNGFAQFVREKRGKKSLRDFSVLMGLSHTAIKDIESGTYTKAFDSLLKIAVGTNTDPSKLIALYLKDLDMETDIKSVKLSNSVTLFKSEESYKKTKKPVPDLLDIVVNYHYTFNGDVITDNKRKQIYNMLEALKK